MFSRREPSSRRSIKLVEDQLDVARLAVRRESHHLVLARVDPEARVVSEGRVEQPQRVRELQLSEQVKLVARARSRKTRSPTRRRRPSSARPPTRTATGRRRCGVRLVMLGEEHLAFEARLLRNLLAYPELLAQPQRHRHQKRAQAARRVVNVGFEQPLEFQQRLVVEGDVVQLVRRRSRPSRRQYSTAPPESGGRASCA